MGHDLAGYAVLSSRVTDIHPDAGVSDAAPPWLCHGPCLRVRQTHGYLPSKEPTGSFLTKIVSLAPEGCFPLAES